MEVVFLVELLIDANKKELVWQSMGIGYLSKNMDKKEERIKEYISKIMEKYHSGNDPIIFFKR
jgi:GH35 family endo-1,4-beta-xylanase